MRAEARASAPGEPFPEVDFRRPAGEPALVAADSVSWRVFKNPVALYVGGVAAVILELAEPRVRTGVWEHTRFRSEPLARLRRTGWAAMVTVYGPRSAAERMIAGVTHRHARVHGHTPGGVPYHALDPELMDWVQATASFGFLRAYHAYVRPLAGEERDDFYAEARPAAHLYGAPGALASESEVEALFAAMEPRLETSPIVFEFLEIMRRTPGLPAALAALQGPGLRAAVTLLPARMRRRLGLGASFTLEPWERRLVQLAGRAADRVVLGSAPPAAACARLGLPARYLYGRPPARARR